MTDWAKIRRGDDVFAKLDGDPIATPRTVAALHLTTRDGKSTGRVYFADGTEVFVKDNQIMKRKPIRAPRGYVADHVVVDELKELYRDEA